MKTIYLHIGSDKAGSSSIQLNLHQNGGWLNARGFHYVNAGLGSPSSGHRHLIGDIGGEHWQVLSQELDALPDDIHSVIISYEGAHFLGDRKLEAIRDFFEGWQVKLIYYIREQAALVQSGILQRMKTGSVEVDLTQISPDSELLFGAQRNYARKLERFESLFGADALMIRVFERSDFLEGDLLTDFLHLLGLEMDDGFEVMDAVNPSYTVEAALLVQIFERLVRDEEELRGLRDLCLRLATVYKGSKYFLSEEAVAAVIDHYEDGNQSVARTYFDREELFPRKNVSNDNLYDNASLMQLMETAGGVHATYPTIQKRRLSGREPLAKRIFAEGWNARARGATTIFDLSGGPGVIRFRTASRRLRAYHKAVRLRLMTVRDAPFKVSVTANGHELGETEIPEGEIMIPIESCRPYDTVEMTVTALDPEAVIPVSALSWNFD